MGNVENNNSSKMIVGFVFGLLAGIIGVLFAQYIVGVDEPEKISSTQQSVETLNNPNQLTRDIPIIISQFKVRKKYLA